MWNRYILLVLTLFCLFQLHTSAKTVKLCGLVDNDFYVFSFDNSHRAGCIQDALYNVTVDFQQAVLDRMNTKGFSDETFTTEITYLYLLLVLSVVIIAVMIVVIVSLVRSGKKEKSKSADLEKANVELLESLNQLINKSEISVYIYELSTRCVYIYRNGNKITSYQEDFSKLSGLIGNELERFHQIIGSLDTDQKEEVAICEVQSVDGRPHYYKYIYRPIWQEGVLCQYVISRQDVSNIQMDLASSNEAIESLQNNLKLALDAAQLSVWTYSLTEDLFIYQHGAIVSGNNVNFNELLKMAHPEDICMIKDTSDQILSGKKERYDLKLRLKTDDGYKWLLCFMQPVYAEDGTIKVVGTSRDITDEMKLNIELQNSKENLQTILDKMPIPICIKEADTQKFLYRNSATARRSLIGEELKDVLSPESFEHIRNVDMEILRTKMNYSANEITQLSSGEIRYTTVNKVLINYQDKECILGLRYDYTDHHRLDQANKLLYMSMPSIKAYTWNIDGRGMKVTYNNVTDMGGVPIEKISTIEDFLEYVHPEDREGLTKQIYDTFTTSHCEVVMIYRFKNINDEYEWWESRAIAETITEGVPEYAIMYGMAINVNENKLNELSLIKLNQQNELILNNHSSGIAYIDSHNVVQWTNMSESKYHRLYEFFKDNYERGVLCSCSMIERKGCPILEAKSYGKVVNNTYEWSGMVLDVCFTPIIDYKGERGLVIRVDDVTEKQKMVRELEIAKEKAEESEKLKMSFLANMSHEIRTPLNAIVGFSELLGDTEYDDMRQEFVDIIQKNSDTLLRLIGDILDLSKIESGNIEVKPKQFDFGAFINDTYKAWEKRSKETNLEVFLDNKFDSLDLVLDPKIVEQVVNNYMSNAFKYTPSGSVTLGCDYSDKGVKIYVRDTGIGVPLEKQHLTFQRFAKLDEFAQGTGLGLSICRGLAESCNGEVGFESVPDKGSTFWAFFPCSV